MFTLFAHFVYCLVFQMSPKRGKGKDIDSEEDSEEYRKKRDRNNLVSNQQFELKNFIFVIKYVVFG